MKIRIKMDITCKADSSEAMITKIIKMLEGHEVEFPELEADSGWCIGQVEHWHLVESTYKMEG